MSLEMSKPIPVKERIGDGERSYEVYCFGSQISLDVWDQQVQKEERLHVVEAVTPDKRLPCVGINSSTHKLTCNALNAQNLGVFFDDDYHAEIVLDSNKHVAKVWVDGLYDKEKEEFAQRALTIVPPNRISPPLVLDSGYFFKTIGSDKITDVVLVNPPDPALYETVQFVPTQQGVVRWYATRTIKDYPDNLRR